LATWSYWQIQGSEFVAAKLPLVTGSSADIAEINWCLYKYRHLVENVFARLKHFRAIATRYNKLKRNFESVVALACAFILLPM
jgi:transposase